MTDDPIRRAAALSPPTSEGVLLLYLLQVLVEEKPKRLAKWLAKARDRAAGANIIRLHNKDGDAAWAAAFAHAEIRAESVAEMIRAELEPKMVRQRKKKR